MLSDVTFQLVTILKNCGPGLIAQLFSGKDMEIRFSDPHLETDQAAMLNAVPVGSLPV
jgi:hypothetical protein